MFRSYLPTPRLALLLLLLVTTDAFAYIDPGTGSILLQGLIAGIAGAAVVVRLYWYRVKDFFGRGPKPGKNDDAAREPDKDDTGTAPK